MNAPKAHKRKGSGETARLLAALCIHSKERGVGEKEALDLLNRNKRGATLEAKEDAVVSRSSRQLLLLLIVVVEGTNIPMHKTGNRRFPKLCRWAIAFLLRQATVVPASCLGY